MGATIHPLQATEVSVVTQVCTRPLGFCHDSHQFWAVLKRHHPESHLQSAQADRYKTWEKNTDRTQTTGENIQTVYRLEIQTSTKRGRKIQTVSKAKGSFQLRTSLSLSHGLYFSPTFCRGLYFRSVYSLYESPNGLYTVCVFLAGFVVVGTYEPYLSVSRPQLPVYGLFTVPSPPQP